MKSIYSFLIVIFSISTCLLVKGNSQLLHRTIPKIDTIRHNEIQSNESAIEAYKFLYQVTKDSADSQRESMHTLIGIIVAFIIFILSSQIFFNWRLNKQEVENLQTLFDKKLANIILENNESQSFLKVALIAEFESKIKDAENRQKESSQKQQVANEKYINLKVQNLKLRIDQANANIVQSKGDIYLSTNKFDEAFNEYLDAAELKMEIGSNPSLACISRSLKGMTDIYKPDIDRVKAIIEYIRVNHDNSTSSRLSATILKKMEEMDQYPTSVAKEA